MSFFARADCDLFNDSEDNAKAEYNVKTIGNLIIWVSRIFIHQHRTHIFQILLAGKIARFLYWDRTALIFSRPFDYAKHPVILAEFV